MGFPSTSTKMGLECEEPKIRTASQLLRSIGSSNAISCTLPSARISLRATGFPFITSSTATRRVFPMRVIQGIQLFIQDRIISRVLASNQRPTAPAAIKTLDWLPILRRIPAYIMGIGV